MLRNDNKKWEFSKGKSSEFGKKITIDKCYFTQPNRALPRHHRNLLFMNRA